MLTVVYLSGMRFRFFSLGSINTILCLLNLGVYHRPHVLGDIWRCVPVSLARLTSLKVEGEIMMNWIRGCTFKLSVLRILCIPAIDQEVAGKCVSSRRLG